MSRSTTKKKATASRLTMSQRITRWCFRPQRLVIAAGLALGALFWPQLHRSLPDVESQQEYQVGIDQITVTPPPRWIPEDLVSEVLHRVELDETMSLQDPTLSERIAAAFVTHPWILQVHRVTKSFPARVHVEVTYRTPVAIVHGVGGGYYAIDESGCVLPGNDFPRSDIDRYPIIENISSVPQGRQGQAWGDPAVAGAAQLAALLNIADDSGQTLWDTWSLSAIEAPSIVGLSDEELDLEYTVRTKGGSTIIWGRSPTTEHPGELAVAKKLQRLNDYHSDFRNDGGFDDASVPYVLDVRPWRGISRRMAGGETATH
jgi:hypothetical protein